MAGSSHPTGTPINLVERFWTVDPVTQVSQLADPTVVTFEVQLPDETTVTFTSGGPEVTNPSVGLWVCAVPAQTIPGIYTWRAVGTGAVEATSFDRTFEVYDSALGPDPEQTLPSSGPCQPWIQGIDVAICGPDDLGIGTDTWLLDDVAADASAILYEITGRRFPGVCKRTVRPAVEPCACWPASSGMGGPWFWTTGYLGGSWGWGWYNESGIRLGCTPLSVVKLSGYPVRRILEVKIDGVVLPELDGHGNPNWRLDSRSDLVRMDDPTDVAQSHRYWPGCQNFALNDDQPTTFSVTYEWGSQVPQAGKAAAAQLAREMWKACSGLECQLPSRVTRIARQGITMERIAPIADALKTGATGLQLVDFFIASVGKRVRRPAVFSPDVQPYARKVGQ